MGRAPARPFFLSELKKGAHHENEDHWHDACAARTVVRLPWQAQCRLRAPATRRETRNLFDTAGEKQTAKDFEPAPDKIRTDFGTLRFEGGAFPTEESVQLIYDEMDLQRATQAYMDFFPAMSLYGIVRSQIRDFGFKTPSDIGVMADFMHPSENYLTGNDVTVYAVRLHRPQGRRPDGGGDPSRNVRQRQRRRLQVPHGFRPDRTRPGQGRKVPLPAPGLRRCRTGRLFRLPLAGLPDLGDDARFRRCR